MNTPGGTLGPHTGQLPYTKCFYMPHHEGRRRQSELSAEATGSTCPNWMAGVPAVQLVHPETGQEEPLDLYLKIYKLHRLPSSPPGELAILKEVSSALPCHSLEEEGTPDAQKQTNPKDFHPP